MAATIGVPAIHLKWQHLTLQIFILHPKLTAKKVQKLTQSFPNLQSVIYYVFCKSELDMSESIDVLLLIRTHVEVSPWT